MLWTFTIFGGAYFHCACTKTAISEHQSELSKIIDITRGFRDPRPISYTVLIFWWSVGIYQHFGHTFTTHAETAATPK